MKPKQTKTLAIFVVDLSFFFLSLLGREHFSTSSLTFSKAAVQIIVHELMTSPLVQ